MSGFTKIDNKILENIATIKLSPTAYRLVFVIWRYTYGFNRRTHNMSLSFLHEATGCDKRQIQRELKNLEDKKVIIQDIKNGSYRNISFNKNHDEWIGKTTIGETAIGEIDNGQTTNSAIGESVKATIGETTNQERNNKENYKERLVTVNVPVPYSEYEKAFGTAPTLILLDDFNYWIDESKLKEPEIIICEAIAIAKKNKANNPARYIKKIIDSWIKQNLLTLSDIQKNNAKFEARNKSKGNDIKLSDMFQQPTKERELTEQERKEIAALEEEMMF